ncbi:MAG: thioredoxin family protein [Deltaproteobacteria bacterium]|nr:thioredoxin family protein [Deltaproteobacteria bacterium]
MRGSFAAIVVGLLGALGCGNADGASGLEGAEAVAALPARTKTVGYDLRRLRPVDDVPLVEMFDRLRADAMKQGKQVAVLFSADWCEPCRHLALELGNMHPPADIGHIRILEFKEEDWEGVTRMNEVNALRVRWEPTKSTYPILVVIDAEGNKVEEMHEARERLEQAGKPTTLPAWFRELRQS